MNIEAKDWLLLLLGTVIAFAMSWYFFRLGKPRGKVLAFFADGLNVVDRTRPETVTKKLEFMFDGQPIPRLSVCEVTLWNDGDEPIQASNIVQSDALRLRIKGEGKILEVRIESADAACELRTSVNPDQSSEALLNFGFMNKEHTFVIRVLHTSRVARFDVAGQIIGGKLSDVRSRERSRLPRLFSVSLGSMALVSIGIYFFATRHFPAGEISGLRYMAFGIPLTAVVVAAFLNRSLRMSPLNRLRLRVEGLTPPDPHV